MYSLRPDFEVRVARIDDWLHAVCVSVKGVKRTACASAHSKLERARAKHSGFQTHPNLTAMWTHSDSNCI